MTLRLDHLYIKNYRCFEELHIPQFKQINLIAGKNNVGKTALLEAIRIWASEGNPYVLSNIIEIRNEFNSKKEFGGFESFFHELLPSITFIDSEDNTASLKIMDQVLRLNNEHRYFIGTLNQKKKASFQYFDFKKNTELREKIEYVPSNITHNNLYLWESIDLTPKKEEVIRGLNLVLDNKNIRDLGVYESYAKVLVSGEDEAVPLKQFGDGLSRILSITLALVSAKDNILLIDEFENGLHYSIQEKLWEFIFQMAKKLNVQVFATTHSRDCIEAFGDVARKKENQDIGQYMRLDKDKEGKIKAVIYEQDELITAVDENIETR